MKQLKAHWHRQYALPVALLVIGLLTSRPAHALFGIDDTLYWIQQLVLMGQQLQQMEQSLRTQADALQLWQTNFQALGNKNTWRQWGTNFLNNPMTNTYGETAPLAAALRDGNNVLGAWHTATLPTQNLEALTGEQLGASNQLAGLASVEATDAVSADAIQVLATYRQQQAQNDEAFAQLQNAVFSDDPETNTLTAQQNITNGALLQLIQGQQTHTATTAALTQQQLIANTYQRNAQVETINNYAQFLMTVAQAPGGHNEIGNSLQRADY